jgi:hypothetical protein
MTRAGHRGYALGPGQVVVEGVPAAAVPVPAAVPAEALVERGDELLEGGGVRQVHNAMPPTIGLNTLVCGLEMSIVKNPTSAARSVVKNVKLGTARAPRPRTARSNPITTSGRIFMTYLLEEQGL